MQSMPPLDPCLSAENQRDRVSGILRHGITKVTFYLNISQVNPGVYKAAANLSTTTFVTIHRRLFAMRHNFSRTWCCGIIPPNLRFVTIGASATYCCWLADWQTIRVTIDVRAVGFLHTSPLCWYLVRSRRLAHFPR